MTISSGFSTHSWVRNLLARRSRVTPRPSDNEMLSPSYGVSANP
jgi:hypothetical protein